jgi:hypothetical protein
MISIRLAAYRRRSRIGAIRIAASATLATIAAMPAAAQSVLAYPARGQSQEQQDRDRSNATSGPCSRRVQLADQQYAPLLEPACSPGRRRRGFRRRRRCDRRRRGQRCRRRGWGWRPFRRHAPARDGDAASASTIAAGGRRGATERRLQPRNGGLSAIREFVLCCGDRARQDAGSQTGGKREPGHRFVAFRAAVPRGGHSAPAEIHNQAPAPSPKANSGADDPFACRGAPLRQEIEGRR